MPEFELSLNRYVIQMEISIIYIVVIVVYHKKKKIVEFTRKNVKHIQVCSFS